MKKIILTITALLALASPSFAEQGNEGGGGGDPRSIRVIAFPDSHKLNSAISILEKSIPNTQYSESLKDNLLAELNSLKTKKMFFYVPQVASLGFNRYKGDYTTLVSVGAFTSFSRGEPIYFSSQVKNYSASELARVIAQEIPHHVLPEPLKFDESFVNPFGESLAKGLTDSRLKSKLEGSTESDLAKAQVLVRLCKERDNAAAGEIIKDVLMKSMDLRYSDEERKRLGELGRELRDILKRFTFNYDSQLCGSNP